MAMKMRKSGSLAKQEGSGSGGTPRKSRGESTSLTPRGGHWISTGQKVEIKKPQELEVSGSNNKV